MGMPVAAIWTQEDYAFYDDGTESGSNIIGSAGAQQTLAVDTIYFCRLAIADTAPSDVNPDNLTCRWQFNLASGGWTNVGTTTALQFANSSNVAHDDTTSNRQPTGTGTFNAGRVYEQVDDAQVVYATPGDNTTSHTEVLLVFQIDSAQVSNGQEILVRCVEGDGTVFGGTYVNADINVQEAVTVEKTATANAALKKAGLTKTATINAALQDTIEKLSTINAILVKVVEKQSTVNAILRKNNNLKLSTINAALQEQGLTKQSTVNAALQKAVTLSSTINAFLEQGSATKTRTSTVNAALYKADLTKTALLNAVLQDTVLTTLTVNATLQKTIGLSATVNAALQKTLTKSATLNAALQKTIDKTATVNAVIAIGGGTLNATVNALLQKLGLTKTATVNALLLKTELKTATVNALLQKRIGLTATINAVNYGTLALSTSFSAWLIQKPGYWPEEGGLSPSYAGEAAKANTWTPEGGVSDPWTPEWS